MKVDRARYGCRVRRWPLLALVAVLTTLGLIVPITPAYALPRLNLTLVASQSSVPSGSQVELSGRSPVWVPGSVVRAQVRTTSGWQTMASAPLARNRSYSLVVEPRLGDNDYRTQLVVRDVLVGVSPVRTVQGLLIADPAVVPAGSPVTVSGRLPTAVARPVELQRVAGDAVPPTLSGVSDSDGVVSFTFSPVSDEIVRVVAPADPARRLTAFSSPPISLMVLGTPPEPTPDSVMPVAVVGEPYDAIAVFTPQIYAPIRLVGGSLPPGLGFSDFIGPTLTGVPATAGTFGFTIETGSGDRRTVSIRVLADPPPADGPVRRTAVASPVDLSGDGSTGVYTALVARGAFGAPRHQIFAWDRVSGRTRQISHTIADDGSYGAVISADGRRAAFHSGDYPNRTLDIADLVTGTIQPVPDALNSCSECPLSLSGDGSSIAFTKDVGGQQAVVLRNLPTGFEHLVSHAVDDFSRPLSGRVADLSDDGHKVTFTSGSDQATEDDSHPGVDVFQWNDATGRSLLVTRTGAPGELGQAVASPDSFHIAYTLGTAMLEGTSYLFDTRTGNTEVVPDPRPDVPGRILTVTTALSEDGRYAVREQMGDRSGTDVYRYDRLTGQVVQLTPDELAGWPIGFATGRSISNDGRVVSMLAGGPGNNFGAVWTADD